MRKVIHRKLLWRNITVVVTLSPSQCKKKIKKTKKLNRDRIAERRTVNILSVYQSISGVHAREREREYECGFVTQSNSTWKEENSEACLWSWLLVNPSRKLCTNIVGKVFRGNVQNIEYKSAASAQGIMRRAGQRRVNYFFHSMLHSDSRKEPTRGGINLNQSTRSACK